MKKRSIICALLSAVITISSAVGVMGASPRPEDAEPTSSPRSTARATSSPDTSDEDDSSDAAETDDAEETDSPSATEKPTGPVEAEADMEDQVYSDSQNQPNVQYADSAVLMDAKSGRILYSQNAQKKKYPASTTKILTGIIALEEGDLSDVVTASYAAIAPITNEDSHMGILIGEQLTLEQLICGMLVYSANDAANVIAIHLAGSLDGFVDKMNQKAAEIGAKNTHFANACGSQDVDHYTTAEDLAIIARYAMQNEKFREIVAMSTYHIDPTNKYTRDRDLSNTNLFISSARSSYHLYRPAIGIKTGHTSDAGYNLVAAAQNNDMELISVVMDCDNQDLKEKAYSYVDSKELLEYGFNNYVYRTLTTAGSVVSEQDVYEAKGGQKASLTATGDISAMIPTDSSTEITSDIQLSRAMAAPISQGEVCGTITYKYGDTVIGSTELVAANEVSVNYLLKTAHIAAKVVTSPFFLIPLVLIILILVINHIQEKKRRRRRQMRQMKRASERIHGTTSRGDQVGQAPHRRVRTTSKPGSTANRNSRYGRDDRDYRNPKNNRR